ncbi:hypothetical protein RhiJN_13767 [Ceratobasidium sp. AG-Ba]|nr:hypothetical protein RhiJN_13767 [Ceratobasidium sp. AG-Ba]
MHAQQIIAKFTGKPAPNADVVCEEEENQQQVINDDDRTQIDGRSGPAVPPVVRRPTPPQHDDHTDPS